MKWNTALFLGIVLVLGIQTSPAQQINRGREIYIEYCQRCHGNNGQGPAGIRNKPVWNQPHDSLVKVIAYGARGSMRMSNGTMRSMVAAPYSDADIAAVSTYSMLHIGKRTVNITEQDVVRVREQHEKNVREKFSGSR